MAKHTNSYIYIDNVRVISMIFGIPFHTALIYDRDDGWLLHSTDNSRTFEVITSMSASFRMACFFMVSGFLSAIVINRKGVKQWYTTRTIRLAVPFLTAMLTLMPLQFLILSNHNQEDNFLEYWIIENQLNIAHLWFILALFIISSLVYAFKLQIDKFIKFSELFSFNIILINAILMNAALNLFHSNHVAILGSNLAPYYKPFDIAHTLQFITPFLFGYCAFKSEIIRHGFLKFDVLKMSIGLACMVSHYLFAHEGDTLSKNIGVAASAISGILLSQSIIALSYNIFSNRNIFGKDFVDASYSIYLIHLPLIIFFGAISISLNINIFIEFAAICLLSGIISYGFHRYVIAPYPALMFLLNGQKTSIQHSNPAKV